MDSAICCLEICQRNQKVTDCYLDIETLDLIDNRVGLSSVRFGIAVTYSNERGWTHWGKGTIEPLWEILCQHDCIIGWNTDGFDLPIIMRYVPFESRHSKFSTLDLFAMIRRDTGRWYKLETVAQANLGHGKSGHGIVAVEWLNSGKPELIQRAYDYCQQDVQLVIDLHRMLKHGRSLILPGLDRVGQHQPLTWLPKEFHGNE